MTDVLTWILIIGVCAAVLAAVLVNVFGLLAGLYYVIVAAARRIVGWEDHRLAERQRYPDMTRRQRKERKQEERYGTRLAAALRIAQENAATTRMPSSASARKS